MLDSYLDPTLLKAEGEIGRLHRAIHGDDVKFMLAAPHVEDAERLLEKLRRMEQRPEVAARVERLSGLIVAMQWRLKQRGIEPNMARFASRLVSRFGTRMGQFPRRKR